MLNQRLNTLEADLQLLLAMQDIFLQEDQNGERRNECVMENSSDFLLPRWRNKQNACQFSNDLPERDGSKSLKSNNNVKIMKGPNATKVCSKFPAKSNVNSILWDNSKSGEGLGQNDHTYVVSNAATEGCGSLQILEQDILTKNLTEEFDKEKQKFQENIEHEKQLRAELEDSAKKVYIRLQKVEDELAREKQTKESLLLGTLKLKNLVQGFNSKIRETDKELNESKAEVQQLLAELKKLSSENSELRNHLQTFCRELGYQPRLGESYLNGDDKEQKTLYFEFLRRKFQDLLRKSVVTEHEEVNKLASQLNNVVGRCAKLERERDDAQKELQQCQRREITLKEGIRASEMSLSSLESDMLKKQIEYECVLQRLQSDMQIEKEQAAVRLSEYSSVVQRSKSLLTSLKNECDEYRKKVQEHRATQSNLEHKLKSTEHERQSLLLEVEQLKCKMKDEIQFKDKSNEEVNKLEMSKKKLESEKRRCIEFLNEMKSQLLLQRTKYEHQTAMQNVENERLKNENIRLDENFRVLQKVSEDQGHTIQKLRGDLETYKNASFKLETQLRDHECTENQLIKKLEEKERQCERYLRQVDQLEEKLEKVGEELKQHDCEDFVESKYRKKLMELEHCFQVKTKEWEESLKRVEMEKSEAIATARKAVQKIEEVQNAHQSQVQQIRSASQTELGQLMERQRKSDNQRLNKMLELQSELDRVKLSSSQIQRALSRKVQQLQAALGICIGSGTGNNLALAIDLNPNNNSSPPQTLHHHHLQQDIGLHNRHNHSQYVPSAAAGFVRAPSATSGFVNIINDTNANLIRNQTACFPIVNDCKCSSAGFGVFSGDDCIESEVL